MSLPQPILLLHGGAWAMPDDAVAPHQHGIANALRAGWSVLDGGGSAVDAVEAAVTVMEDDETFDAGRGSFLTRDGRVQLDALLMNGANLRSGGVACVERLRNPIQAARLVLERSPHVYFVGAGAESFAEENGMRLINNSELIVPRECERLLEFQRSQAAGRPDTTFTGGSEPEISPAAQSGVGQGQTGQDRGHDTVGAVALDQYGHLAAGTSTGGTLSKAPGRVGDSSLIGCGCYADDLSAAVSLTGWGEPIMKLVLGKWAVDRVAAGSAAQDAATAAIDYLFTRLGGHGGIILLAPNGEIGIAHNTPRMAWGWATRAGRQLGITRN
ncbi:MAG: isoaspartyl peptidase/L-asparaginase [Acidobacteriaceae bacterium]